MQGRWRYCFFSCYFCSGYFMYLLKFVVLSWWKQMIELSVIDVKFLVLQCLLEHPSLLYKNELSIWINFAHVHCISLHCILGCYQHHMMFAYIGIELQLMFNPDRGSQSSLNSQSLSTFFYARHMLKRGLYFGIFEIIHHPCYA